MPKVKYAASIESLTGKMGGSTGKRIKSGFILRPGQRTRQPHSAKQQETRALYNRYAGLWSQLSGTEQAIWHKFASLLPQTISGPNAYIQHNVRLIKARHVDLAAITSPPQTPSTPEQITGHQVLRIAPTTMRYQWTGPSDTSNWVELYWAPAAGYDITGKQKWTHVDTTRSDTEYIEWANDYPLETPIHTRARTIDVSGRVSPWTDVLRWQHGVPAPIGTGCVLYLPMDEGTGTIAHDASGNQNNGQIVGATWVPGKYKYALSFDGLDDYANCGNHPTLDMDATNFTAQTWVKTNDPCAPPGRTILSNGRWGPGNYQYRITQGLIHWWINEFTPHTATGSILVNDDLWHHITLLYDGSSLHLFTDGLLDTSTPVTGTITTTDDIFAIGARPIIPDTWFLGLIDQVRLYNRALSAHQIYDTWIRLV